MGIMGVPGTTNFQAAGSVTSIKSIANVGSTAVAAATSANPLGLGLTIAGGAVNLISRLFNPSQCSKKSEDAETFLGCWKHPIPSNQIPVWSTSRGGWGLDDGGKTDSAWAQCIGANGGRAPVGGCQPFPAGRACQKAYPSGNGGPITWDGGGKGICAQVGAIAGAKGGGFIGGGVAAGSAILALPPGIAPLTPTGVGAIGTPLGNTGYVSPFSAQSLLSSLGLGQPAQAVDAYGRPIQAAAVNSGMSTGLIILIAGVGVLTLVFALHNSRR